MRYLKIVCISIIALGWLASSAAADMVSFSGLAKAGKSIELRAELLKPPGQGPFPAVVLLSGCAGIQPFVRQWAAKFVDWGYLALIVDSFGPRGVKSVCNDPFLVSFATRADDAYAARKYLAGSPLVKPDRIFLIGWSHGGKGVLTALLGTLGQAPGPPFRAAVAFYPYCNEPLDAVNAPLLILIGELDDWCPASYCVGMLPKKQTANEVIVKVYPGAYHRFDADMPPMDRLGHHLEYNPEAASDAAVQVRSFFGKYGKQEE
jgi:dienelactone hydrolase